MFAVIRHYHFNPKDRAEIDRRAREEFVPIVKKAKGLCATIGLILARARARPSASSGTKLALISQYTWLRTTSESICLNSSRRNPRSSKGQSKLMIEH
jgi:hypothetical protein